MSTVQRIAKNSAVLIIAQVVMTIMGLFFTIYTARHLGAEGFGIIAFALALTQLFAVLSNIGVGPLAVREVARDRSQAPKYVANMALMNILLSIIAFAAIALAINLMDYPRATVNVVYLMGLSIILTSLTAVPHSIFQAFEKLEYVSLGRILGAALLLLGLIPALKYDFSVVGFAWLYVFAHGGVLVVSVGILVWKFFASPEWSLAGMRVDWGFWKPTFMKALPFGLTTVALASLHHTDTVMLSAMVPDSNQVVGWYNAAFRIILMLMSIKMAISMAAFPIMSRAYVDSKETLKLMCERFFKYYLILALPVGVGTTILALRFILVVYEADYLNSVIVLQIMVWSAVIMFLNFTPTLFQAINRQFTVTKIVVFGALFNVALNALLIPKFSYTGAAAATVATSALSFVFALAVFSRTEYSFSVSFALRNSAKVLVAASVMGMFAWRFQNVHLAGVVFASALLYFVLLLLMRTFDSTDSKILNSLLRGQVLSITPEDEDVEGAV